MNSTVATFNHIITWKGLVLPAGTKYVYGVPCVGVEALGGFYMEETETLVVGGTWTVVIPVGTPSLGIGDVVPLRGRCARDLRVRNEYEILEAHYVR